MRDKTVGNKIIQMLISDRFELLQKSSSQSLHETKSFLLANKPHEVAFDPTRPHFRITRNKLLCGAWNEKNNYPSKLKKKK